KPPSEPSPEPPSEPPSKPSPGPPPGPPCSTASGPAPFVVLPHRSQVKPAPGRARIRPSPLIGPLTGPLTGPLPAGGCPNGVTGGGWTRSRGPGASSGRASVRVTRKLGTFTVAVTPAPTSAPDDRYTPTPCRAASRPTTNSPIRRDAETSTDCWPPIRS